MKPVVPILKDIDAWQFDWRHKDLQVEVLGQNGRDRRGKVAIASVCFASTAAPMKIGIWQMTFSRGIAASSARCMI